MKLTAYVTGADRGLGLALTTVLLEQGYQVFAGSYLTEWGQLTQLKEQHPDRLIVVPLDVTSDESVADAAELISRHSDSLDVVINNAAIFMDRSGTIFEPLYFDDMRKIIETNTFGPLRVTHSVVSMLLKGNQKLLVNISSESGSIGNNWRKKEFAYSMSKSAINMQCAMLQTHLKEFGVKVFAFHPGWVRSYMLGKLNEEATVEPIDSAKGIYHCMMTRAGIDGPMYMDYQGNAMPW